MDSHYSFKTLESIAEGGQLYQEAPQDSSFISRDYRITFDSLVENPAPEKNSNSLIAFPGQDELRQMYLDAVGTPGFLSTGILSFYDYSFFENCALPIDVFRREAIIGEPIGWGIDFAEWYAGQHGLSELLDKALSRNYIESILQQVRNHSIEEEMVVLSAPGQEIYGHWLLDMLARLRNLGLSQYQNTPILLNNMPGWAEYFLPAFNIDPARIRKHPSTFFKIPHAIVPSLSKSGYRLGSESLRKAWQQVLDNYTPPSIEKGLLGEKIWFSRRNWAGNQRRTLANLDEIEQLLVARGYRIIIPETLSIAQQICLMREARIVVGEDGSALHNIIFCDPGARMGVLTLPERSNLWHMGICQTLGHRLAYGRLPEDAQTPVDIAWFHSFLDALET